MGHGCGSNHHNIKMSLKHEDWNNRSPTSRASASYTLTTPLSLPMAVSVCDDDDDVDPVVDMLLVLVPPCQIQST